MVTGIGVDERTGKATGVHYIHGGLPRFQRAALVAVAGYSIETPRLLLNSASRRFPDGLCNDFDQVGRYLMVQGAPQTAGRFDAEVRMYKAPPPEVSSEQFYETDPAKPYQRGFSIQTVSPLPITWAEHVAAQGHWGAVAARVHERLRALVVPGGAVRVPAATGEPGHPRPRRRTAHGLPVARFAYSQCDNDRPAHAGRPGRHGADPAGGRSRRGDHHQALRPPGRRRPDGRGRAARRRRRRLPQLRGAQPATSPTAACCPPRAAPIRR